MDMQSLKAHARARFDHESARRILREKHEAAMLFAYAGGMWRAGPALLTVLSACPDETAVILDLYDTPVKISVTDMIQLTQQRWQEQMNAWLVEYEQSNQQR